MADFYLRAKSSFVVNRKKCMLLECSPSPPVSHIYTLQECLFSPPNCRGNLGDLCKDVSVGAHVNLAEQNQRDGFYLNASQSNTLFRMGFTLQNLLQVATGLSVPLYIEALEIEISG